MSAFTRTQNVMDDPDDWATENPKAVEPGETLAPVLRQKIEGYLGEAVADVTGALDALDKTVATTVDTWLTDQLAYGHCAELVGWLQDTKRRLAVVEAYVAREMIKDPGCPDKITLPDGRQAEVLRGATRKAWDHGAWQHDVRAAVLVQQGVDPDSTIVDAGTGEAVPIHGILSAVQGVHGAQAPKSTALKALGLAAGDYCETLPGTISVKISAPESTTPITNLEN